MDGRRVEQRLLTGSPGLRGEGGFTLVEALVSVGIGLTMMLAVLTMFGTALRVFDSSGVERIPVVSPTDRARIVGWASQVAALARYNKALIEASVEEHR